MKLNAGFRSFEAAIDLQCMTHVSIVYYSLH